jgi:hypothetical protein
VAAAFAGGHVIPCVTSTGISNGSLSWSSSGFVVPLRKPGLVTMHPWWRNIFNVCLLFRRRTAGLLTRNTSVETTNRLLSPRLVVNFCRNINMAPSFEYFTV